ncbi:MAG: DDE-type integrase/transposase/recombinase [Pseudomonadota bacterium]
MQNPFRYFNSSPEVIRLAVMMYIRYPLSLRQVEDLLHERGIDICHETARFWWNRFVPMFAAEIRERRVQHHSYSNWRWLNKRAENSHQPFRRREGAMARFRDIKTLQKFASAHASIHNHFNLDRHLNRRETFKENRAAALAEWRHLAA